MREYWRQYTGPGQDAIWLSKDADKVQSDGVQID